MKKKIAVKKIKPKRKPKVKPKVKKVVKGEFGGVPEVPKAVKEQEERDRELIESLEQDLDMDIEDEEDDVVTVFGGAPAVTKEQREEEGHFETKYEEFLALSEKGNEDEPFGDFFDQYDKLPSLSWFSEGFGWESVCDSLGYHHETFTKDYFLDLFYNVAVFVRDEEEIENIPDEVISNMVTGSVDLLSGQEPPTFHTREEAVEYLKEFYEGVLTGENRFYYKEKDRVVEYAKEREKSVIDPEFTLVDLTEEEEEELLPKRLTAEELSMPEIEEIDKELEEKGVVAVRDESGRFLKGQKAVRNRKNIYSEKLPKLACNTCYKSGDCPEYKPDAVCAYDKIFKRFDTRDIEDVSDALDSMLNHNLARTQRAMMFETMDGGIIDPTVTSLIDQNFSLLAKAQSLQEQRQRIVATQRRTLYADGTEETTSSISNPAGEGVLAQFFGNMMKEEEKEEKVAKEVNSDVIDMEDVE